MDNPLVSVIIASYNHAAYVVESLESLRQQRYTNWELVICDDASKDNGPEVIHEWLALHNIKAVEVFHAQNRGLCNTINECLTYCKGKYIKFLAADDIIHPDLLAESVEKLENLDDSYGMVYTNAQVINGKSETEESYLIDPGTTFREGWVKDDLYKGNFVPALTALVKKEVYDKLGDYDPDILVEDYDMWLRMSFHYQFAAIPKVLGYYRIHGDNISLKHNVFDDIARIMIKYDKFGEYSKDVDKLVIDRFNYGNISNELRNSYLHYKGKSWLLVTFLKYRLPYLGFKIIYTIFYRNK